MNSIINKQKIIALSISLALVVILLLAMTIFAVAVYYNRNNIDLIDKLEVLEGSLAEKTESANQLTLNLDTVNGQNLQLRGDIEKKSNENVALKLELSILNNKITQCAAEMDSLRKLLEDKRVALDELRELGTDKQRKEITELTIELGEKNNSITQLQGQIEQSQEQIEQLQGQLKNADTFDDRYNAIPIESTHSPTTQGNKTVAFNDSVEQRLVSLDVPRKYNDNEKNRLKSTPPRDQSSKRKLTSKPSEGGTLTRYRKLLTMHVKYCGFKEHGYQGVIAILEGEESGSLMESSSQKRYRPITENEILEYYIARKDFMRDKQEFVDAKDDKYPVPKTVKEANV